MHIARSFLKTNHRTDGSNDSLRETLPTRKQPATALCFWWDELGVDAIRDNRKPLICGNISKQKRYDILPHVL